MKDLCLPITDYGTNVDEFILFIHQIAVGERAWCPLNIKYGKHEKYGWNTTNLVDVDWIIWKFLQNWL